MSKPAFEIQPLFAEPIYRADLSSAISDDQVAYTQNLKMVKNRTNLISDDLYIFKDPKLKSLADAVQHHLDIYARDVMGISQTLYVTQSWALTNPPGAGMHGHSHSNSLISGSLYYAPMPEPPARMVFDRHTAYQAFQLTPSRDKQSIFNTPINMITPKSGELLLFASSLQHFVEPNNASVNRHSIAFNSFIKGRLGNYRDVSELEL